jgi:hypothetical protein
LLRLDENMGTVNFVWHSLCIAHFQLITLTSQILPGLG